MKAPRQLPDLTPLASVPRPMDARWMSAHKVNGYIFPRRLFPGERTVPGAGSYVMTDHTNLRFHDWCPSSLKVGGYDGVSKVLLKYHPWRDPKGHETASMVLRREIRQLETGIDLRLELSDLQRPRRLKPRVGHSFFHLCGMVAMIMCGDIYRQTARLKERQLNQTITTDLDASGLRDELREVAPVWIESILQELAPLAGLSPR